MYYCFVYEDIIHLEETDPLFLQAEYARYLGRYCCLSLKDGSITDGYEIKTTMKERPVLLRATCDTMEEAAAILEKQGISLVEKREDIEKIYRWNELGLTRRKILSLTLAELEAATLPEETALLLNTVPAVFLKSRKKGFCARIPSAKILEKDSSIFTFLREQCEKFGRELLMAPLLTVKKDSLGAKESRHFVKDGELINCSRVLHSVKHKVPKSQIKKAWELVERIGQIESFPVNYVLDLGEFEMDGETFTDIVEMNPMTSSLCYVNNSIFEDVGIRQVMESDFDRMMIDLAETYQKTGMGMEYCFDYLTHPERYTMERVFGANYEYANMEHYDFT